MSTLSIPAAELGDAADQSAVAAVMGPGRMSEGLPLAGPTLWTLPLWYAKKDTRKVRVWQSAAGTAETAPCWQPSRWTSIDSWPVLLPWASNFRTAEGTDMAALVELGDGRGYECQGLRPVTLLDLLGGLWWTTKGAARIGDWVCDSLHLRTPGPETDVARGAGKIAELTGLVLVSMIDAGVIPVAISLALRNIQYGPGARFVPPATRVEHPHAKQRASTGLPSGDSPLTIPHGTRFRLAITDAEIAAWLDARGYTGAKRNTARIFAIALRDYGCAVLLTCDQRPYLETEGMMNPDTAVRWKANGMSTIADFRTLLDGLISVDRLKVVKPA